VGVDGVVDVGGCLFEHLCACWVEVCGAGDGDE
jgi:hypothetical protein